MPTVVECESLTTRPHLFDHVLPSLIKLAIEGPDGMFKCEGNSGADIMGAMHCKPAQLGAVLEAVEAQGWDGPMMAYPDDVREWDPTMSKGVYGNDPVDVYCSHCLNWSRDFPKCNLLGACCGFSVRHIAAFNQRLGMGSPGGKL